MLQTIRYFYNLNLNQSTNENFIEKKQVQSSKNISIYGCYELKEFYKSKKDSERGIEKLPGEHMLINLEPCLNF